MNWRRMDTLSKQNAVSLQSLDSARTQRDLAQGGVHAAEGNFLLLQTRLTRELPKFSWRYSRHFFVVGCVRAARKDGGYHRSIFQAIRFDCSVCRGFFPVRRLYAGADDVRVLAEKSGASGENNFLVRRRGRTCS